MARKVFISFLGTNNYVSCKYKFDDGWTSTSVRFVQEAMVEYLCEDWTEDDRIMVFCTSEAKELNWLDNGQKSATCEEERIGLGYRLNSMLQRTCIKAQVEQYDIEPGFSEEEIWNIFDTVYACLDNGDDIYFDVTHAFRSIPLFSVVLFNYAKFMKKISLKSIMYGAFEKLGPTSKVKDMPIEERIAPIVDLTNVARLQEYNQIASSLKQFGKVKEVKGNIGDQSSQIVQKLEKSITLLEEYIETLNIQKIRDGGFIRQFRENYVLVKKKQEPIKPISRIIDEINFETSGFTETPDYRNIEESINWTIKHDQLLQAYLMTREYLLLRLSEETFADLRPTDVIKKQFKEMIGALLGMTDDSFCNRDEWTGDIKKHEQIAIKMSEHPRIIGLRPYYAPVGRMRNNVAHANPFTYSELKKGITDIMNCLTFIHSEYVDYPSTIYIIDHKL